ncbi:VanW family protein [Thermorudis peleae]|uniref:VanW family protein n=1 Tax=Thermorudis peleae TaxID=1382356 RepID=UPI0005716874|nr:peptidoglycan binding domain-containing protein [Thermorudis peleae]
MADIAPARQWSIAQQRVWHVSQRALLLVAATLALLCMLSGAAVLAYGYVWHGKIYPGVTVAGIPVGGLTQQQAEARIATEQQAFAQRTITLRADGREWPLALADLHVMINPSQAADAAYRYGRTGDLWHDSAAWVRARLFGAAVSSAVTIDPAAFVKQLAPIAEGVAQPPVDAHFTFDGKGIQIAPDHPGRGIDVATLYAMLVDRLGQRDTAAIAVPFVTIKPTITADTLKPLLPQAQAAFGQPLVLVAGDQRWAIPPSDLVRLFTIVTSSNGNPTIQPVDRAAVESYLATLRDHVSQAPRDATVRWQGGRFVVVPPQPGQVLDPAGSVDAIVAALQQGKHDVVVRTVTRPAAVTAEMAQQAADRAQSLVNAPLTLHWGTNGTATLRPDQMAQLLTFVPKNDASGGVAGLDVAVDDAAVSRLLQDLAPNVHVDARDAQLRYLNGQVKVVAPEQPGQDLDVAASASTLKQALMAGQRDVQLTVKTTPPKITAAMASQIQIREKISSGATYYGGSVPNRKYNVELAVQRVNGALVPPGGVFSFDATVGPIDLKSGFKVGYGIVATNGQVATVPSVGGGVCQVSTTLFHAAFWGGFPIVERNWHLYWIPLYGQPPSGLTGLDATVDTDYGLDFKFRNTTNDWIAIVATADGQWVRFEIWGTKPNWRVEVDNPVITNVVKADPTPRVEVSPDLPPGARVVVEEARDGFDAMIHRRVYQGDQLIDDLVLKSHYLPSSNVTLVGPSPNQPASSSTQPAPEPIPSPSPQPSTTPTPTPAAKPSTTPTPSH